MTEYNGHPSRQYWNVNMWMYNDEGLYHMLQEAVSRYGQTEKAAEYIRSILEELDYTSTPDGYEFSIDALEYVVMEYED